MGETESKPEEQEEPPKEALRAENVAAFQQQLNLKPPKVPKSSFITASLPEVDDEEVDGGTYGLSRYDLKPKFFRQGFGAKERPIGLPNKETIAIGVTPPEPDIPNNVQSKDHGKDSAEQVKTVVKYGIVVNNQSSNPQEREHIGTQKTEKVLRNKERAFTTNQNLHQQGDKKLAVPLPQLMQQDSGVMSSILDNSLLDFSREEDHLEKHIKRSVQNF